MDNMEADMKGIVLCLTLCFVLAVMAGCSAQGNDSSGNKVNNALKLKLKYGGTSSPGDYWEWDLDWKTSTFAATNYSTSYGKTASLIYAGTIELLASGFTKFVVTNTDDANVTIGTSNAVSYGVEVPGTVILVQSTGTNDEAKHFIAATAISSDMPVNGTVYNFIRVPNQAEISNSDDTSGMNYGTSAISGVSGNTFNSAVTIYDWSNNLLPGSPSSNCIVTNGKIYSPSYESPQGVSIMTPSGFFSCDMGNNGGLFGCIQPAASINLTNAFSKKYRGFNMFYCHNQANLSGGPTPGWVNPGTNGVTFIGGVYISNDVELGVLDTNLSSHMSYADAGEAVPGLFTNINTVHTNLYTDHVTMIITKVNGKYVLIGEGRMNPGTTNMILFNYICVEVD
jgi:hypothetical protein